MNDVGLPVFGLQFETQKCSVPVVARLGWLVAEATPAEVPISVAATSTPARILERRIIISS